MEKLIIILYVDFFLVFLERKEIDLEKKERASEELRREELIWKKRREDVGFIYSAR